MITIALGALGSQDGIVKLLVARYSVWQLILFRSLFAAVFISAILWAVRAPSPLRARHLGGQYLRGTMLFFAFTCYYLAIASMPLLDAVGIFYSSPLIATAISTLYLKERAGARRWGAVALGFAGAFIMIRLGFGVFQTGALFALGAAIAYAAAVNYTNRLGRTESGVSMAYYTNLIYVAFAGLGIALLEMSSELVSSGKGALIRGWLDPTWTDLGWLALAGAAIALGLVCIAQAYRSAPVSLVSPFEYNALLWAGLVGYVGFAEIPDGYTVAGAVIISVAGLYLIRLETQRRSPREGPGR